MATTKVQRKITTKVYVWRPTDEDKRIVEKLVGKLGVNTANILRMAIRKLAEEQRVA